MPPTGRVSKLGRFSHLRSEGGEFRRTTSRGPELNGRSRSYGARREGATVSPKEQIRRVRDEPERVTRIFGRSQSQKNKPTVAMNTTTTTTTSYSERKSVRSPSPLKRRVRPVAPETVTPEDVIEKTKHITIDQLWVPITMQSGRMTVTNSSDEFCNSCSAAILCSWCSPLWVFKSQKQILQQRKSAINSAREARTLLLEHKARRKSKSSAKINIDNKPTSKYDDEGYVVDELYGTIVKQSALIEELTSDLEETKEKTNSLQRCGEGFTATISDLKKELQKYKNDCDRLRASIHQVQYRHQEQLSTLGNQSVRSTPQRGMSSPLVTPLRANMSQISSTVTPTSVNYTSLSPTRGRLQPCHVAIEQCEHLTKELTSECVCSTYATADVVNAFQIAKRNALKLETRLEDSLRDKKTLELWNSELVAQTSRVSQRRHRSASPTPTVSEFQERLKHVKDKADFETVKVRAGCAYQVVSSKATEVGVTHSELLNYFIDEDSETSILLHQLEPQSDGYIPKDEWVSWFAAMHNIGQSIDHILDWLITRIRRMEHQQINEIISSEASFQSND